MVHTNQCMKQLNSSDDASESWSVADPENKAGGFTTTVRKSLHVTSIRGRVREGDVPPPARSAEAQRCSTICGRYLIEKSARQSTFNLA